MDSGARRSLPHDWLDVRRRPALRCATSVAPGLLRPLLASLSLQIEADQRAREWVRSHARATLVARMAAGHGCALEELGWLMELGERFFAWGYASEGVVYWCAIQTALGRRPDHREQGRVDAWIAGLRVLSGEAPRDAEAIARVSRALGAAHPLARAMASATPDVSSSVRCAWVAPRAAHLDVHTRRALWITLAFLRCTVVDGASSALVCADTAGVLQRLGLPDAWVRFGSKRLVGMLCGAMLEELSAEFVQSAPELRHELVGALWDLVIDARTPEIEVAERVGGWLGYRPEYD